MLDRFKVAAMIPASDLERAKSFYADKLGLKPVEEREGSVKYACADGTEFDVFVSTGQANGEHTQLGWEVDELEKVVAELRERGVKIEEYDFPGFKTVNGIAEIDGERGAWFKDSEGNLLAVAETTKR